GGGTTGERSEHRLGGPALPPGPGRRDPPNKAGGKGGPGPWARARARAWSPERARGRVTGTGRVKALRPKGTTRSTAPPASGGSRRAGQHFTVLWKMGSPRHGAPAL